MDRNDVRHRSGNVKRRPVAACSRHALATIAEARFSFAVRQYCAERLVGLSKERKRCVLFMQVSTLIIVIAATGVVSAVTAQTVEETADPRRTSLHNAIADVAEGVKRATWTQTSFQRLGEREEYTAATCFWAGPDSVRLDVYAGRGKGAVAVLRGKQVTGFRRGLLRFAKRTYDVRHPRVLSLRGRDMRDNGYFDELQFVFRNWPRVEVTFSRDAVLLVYADEQGLTNRLYLRGTPPVVFRHEIFADDLLVEVYTYGDVVYDATFDSSLLEP